MTTSGPGIADEVMLARLLTGMRQHEDAPRAPPPIVFKLKRPVRRASQPLLTAQHIDLLTEAFRRNASPSSSEIAAFSHMLGLSDHRIRIWFAQQRLKLAVQRNADDDSADTHCINPHH